MGRLNFGKCKPPITIASQDPNQGTITQQLDDLRRDWQTDHVAHENQPDE